MSEMTELQRAYIQAAIDEMLRAGRVEVVGVTEDGQALYCGTTSPKEQHDDL